MRRFSSFNHSTCKTVLNLLEAVYLRLRKIVVERVTVARKVMKTTQVGRKSKNLTPPSRYSVKAATHTGELVGN